MSQSLAASVVTSYGCMLQGTTEVALSLIDVLGYLDEIPVCTAYLIDDAETRDFPVTPLLNRAKPVYTMLQGWRSDIRGVTRYEELPGNARNYVKFIEEYIGCPVRYISTGPGRSDIIERW